jgi:hypothetical protein
MPTQVEACYQQREQERSRKARLEIAVVEQGPCTQGRHESHQGGQPYTAQRGQEGSQPAPTPTHPESSL